MNGSYLIINAFSARNAGDAAIVLATAAVLRENGAAEIRSATRYFEQDREFYAAHNIEVVPPLVPFAPRPGHGSSRWRVLSLFAGIPIAFAVVALSRFTPARARRLAERLKRAGVMELLAADRVIICGGGYLYSARGALNLTLVHVILSTKLSQLARKGPLMMPQSVGPLPRHLDRVLVSWGFSKVRPIVVRDEIAYREAREILPSAGADIHVCPDIAFVRWPSSRPSGSPETQKARVGIVAMDWTWARRVDRRGALDRYVAKLADVARALARRGWEVRLYGHSRIPEMHQDDISVAQRIADGAGNIADVQVDLAGATGDVAELRELFGSLSVVIGTRLHSCIIAMSAGTPAVGLAYQYKSLGTFQVLGLEDYCLDVESFAPAHVEQLAAELAEDRGRQRDVVTKRVGNAQRRIQAFYAQHLRQGVPDPDD